MVQNLFRKTIEKYSPQLELVAENLGSKGVADLERLATAYYVGQEIGFAQDPEIRVNHLIQLKPHISLEEAHSATKAVDGLIRKSKASTAQSGN